MPPLTVCCPVPPTSPPPKVPVSVPLPKKYPFSKSFGDVGPAAVLCIPGPLDGSFVGSPELGSIVIPPVAVPGGGGGPCCGDFPLTAAAITRAACYPPVTSAVLNFTAPVPVEFLIASAICSAGSF